MLMGTIGWVVLNLVAGTFACLAASERSAAIPQKIRITGGIRTGESDG